MSLKKPNRTTIGLMVLFVLLAAAVTPLSAQQGGSDREPLVQVIPHYEIGYLGVLSHLYQAGEGETPGNGGTLFNFVTMGGQDILFPYQRYSAELVLGGRNRVTLLYQPLTLNTRTVVGRNDPTPSAIYIDDATFAAGTPIDITYGFDFWRVSWLYDFARSPNTILGAGISLQLRNASIVFRSVWSSRLSSSWIASLSSLKSIRIPVSFSPSPCTNTSTSQLCPCGDEHEPW